jgi:hypothetical protein
MLFNNTSKKRPAFKTDRFANGEQKKGLMSIKGKLVLILIICHHIARRPRYSSRWQLKEINDDKEGY